MKKSIAIIHTSSPYHGSEIKDALDIAMIMGSYEQDVHLYFIGDGVFQLMANQSPSTINVKDVFKTFAAFEFYDIEHLYVCEESLKSRGLSTDFHIANIQVLSKIEMSNSIHQHTSCLRF